MMSIRYTSGVLLWATCAAAPRNGAAQAEQIELGRTLYNQHCAACHGANLEGAADWQRPGPDGRLPAPSHDETGHTSHHGDGMLFGYTRRGGQAFIDDIGVRYASGMPAFGDILSGAEIEVILAFLRLTWPEEIRTFQAQRTSAWPG